MTHVDYVSDNGNTYRTRTAQWIATLVGAGAATSTTPLPRGLRIRRRYLMESSGRERSVPVFSTASTFWTEPYGTAHTIPALNTATPISVTASGRTGERDKNI
jgi:hypothetical protein